MAQQISDNFWQAEARSEETRQFIKDTERPTRHKFTAEEKIRIVLGCFRRDFSSGISAGEKASIPPPTMPG